MIARFTILFSMESMYPASAALNVPLVSQLTDDAKSLWR